MATEVKIPAIGESVTEATLATWIKGNGEHVNEGEVIAEIESDKASVELPAEVSGVLKHAAQEGDELAIGAVIALIEEGEASSAGSSSPVSDAGPEVSSGEFSASGEPLDVKIPVIGESVTEATLAGWQKQTGDFVNEGDILCEIESDKASVELPAEVSGQLEVIAEEGQELAIGAVIAKITPGAGGTANTSHAAKVEVAPSQGSNDTQSYATGHASPAARKILAEKNMSAADVKGTGKDGRVTKNDAANASAQAPSKVAAPKKAETSSSPSSFGGSREVRPEKMTRLRKTIAKRLVEAKNSTAMLTTFNEVDMYEVMNLRKKYKEAFKEKFDVNLGFMSIFTKACTMALQEVPAVNAQIKGEEILFHDYVDMGIAVSTPKGLVVPVIRNAESLPLQGIEKEVLRLALKGRDGKLSIDEMQGGTFTITNGGIFGSMLSTPIINIPQSAILGMHNIVQRPVAIDGQVVIRPIMYLALSYDHRIVDGKESVTFLKRVKEYIEDPSRLLLGV